MKNIKKIAVLRTGGLGDLMVILPALSAIKHTFPGAQLILLGEPWQADFVRGGRTPVDQVIVIPFCHNLRQGREEDPAALEAFFRAMRQKKIDIAVHFQGKGVAANPFLKKLNARLTVGNSSPGAALPDCSIPFYYYQNEITRYLDISGLIGAGPAKPEPQIRVLDEDLAEARSALARHGAGAPYVVLHPGAMDIRRKWPPAKFARLADILAGSGYTVLLTGKEKDDPAVEAVLFRMTSRAVNLSGALSLGGLAGLLSQSEVVISNDTGPLHLARAAGAKTVGIYWAPNFINWGPLTFSRHRAVISWNMECPLCGTVPNDPYPFEPKLPECDHGISFVRNISAKEILEAAGELLGKDLAGKRIEEEQALTDQRYVVKKDNGFQGFAIR
ncbi:glycosyltransferase family 9 protein [Anseongella ginsenosidimutans]|nr:glycosyltransferase family 9 protein [Anseongella ginsenosidimutans]QEC52867.1 glycosyltransferase family 9 protein [Anseongella ginsenosidimutans]